MEINVIFGMDNQVTVDIDAKEADCLFGYHVTDDVETVCEELLELKENAKKIIRQMQELAAAYEVAWVRIKYSPALGV